MTLAEFEACLRGFLRSRTGKSDADVPSDDDFYNDLADEMAAGRVH